MRKREYDAEPVRGLPERLPAGEHILWQGGPRWFSIARQVFHVRAVLLYFGLLGAWFSLSAYYDGAPAGQALSYAAWTGVVALCGVTVLCTLAWLIARTTVYTITNKRIVMRFGVAFPMAVNIPFAIVDCISLKKFANGTGNLAIKLTGPDGMAYLHLWPHVRPMKFSQAEPMLRGIPDAGQVAEMLNTALENRLHAHSPRAGKPVRIPGLKRELGKRAQAAA